MLGVVVATLASAGGGLARLAGLGHSCGADVFAEPWEPAASDDDSSRGGSSLFGPVPEDGDAAARAVLLDEARRDLPAPWLAIWSRSRYKYYYFNPKSQDSFWFRPKPNPGEPASEEDSGSIVGSWAYSDGAYTIAIVDNELRYREEAHRLHGVVEEHDGWLVADLMLVSDDSFELSGAMTGGEFNGRLRLLRKGSTVVSNFQRVGPDPDGVWGEDVVATKSMRLEIPEAADSLVGSWSYQDGTYSVSRKQDRLLYEETCYSIYGWLVEVSDGWMEAEVWTLSTSTSEPAHRVGWIRLKRHGLRIVSNFRAQEDSEWEPESIATKEVGSVEGEWIYPDGTYTISNKHGFLLYQEPSCGIYGVLQQDPSGWMEADLQAAVEGAGGSSDTLGTEEKRIGKIRLQRRGTTVVSNFRRSHVEPWERDIVATRVDD